MNDELIFYLEGLLKRLKTPSADPVHVLDRAVIDVVSVMQTTFTGETSDHQLIGTFDQAAAMLTGPFVARNVVHTSFSLGDRFTIFEGRF